MCTPPLPVAALAVFGGWPHESSSRATESVPSPASTSRTSSPERTPVGIATFAFGHLPHHRRMLAPSVVASRKPSAVGGLFLPPRTERRGCPARRRLGRP